MHVQIVNFSLDGLDDPAYRSLCDEFAETFAAVPGLISKVWLANPETGTYGGVYTWESRDAMERFAESDLFAAVATNPNFADLRSTNFEVLQGPTRVTSGLAGLAA